MLLPGLLSVTFRQLNPRHILSLAQRAKLASIEWGGDVHVPHGDVARAAEVGRMTRDAGLEPCAYGSYYRLAHPDPVANPLFERVLDSAVALNAPLIRVWPGATGSADTSPAQRAAVVADAKRIALLAAATGVKVALEYHTKTLTDTNESAQQLLREVNHPNLYLLWQPTPTMSSKDRLAGLQQALPRLENLHVYHYTGSAYGPLADIADEWRTYFSLARTTGGTHHCLLEFVQGNSPESFQRDAATLRDLLADANAQ